MITAGEAWRETEAAFRRARLHYGHGTAGPRDEAAWLVCAVGGIGFDHLDAQLDRTLAAPTLRRLRRIAAQRIASREPLAYLLREAWLVGHRFHVDRRVIVPRSFIAELLPDRLAPWLARRRVRRVLDLCTGSGCLAVLAALAWPRAHVDAVDLSAGALAIARRNVGDYGLNARVRVVRSDLFAALAGERYDLIVSNPPYVNTASMRRLPEEYRREPEMALAGGKDGLSVVDRILAQAARQLTREGVLLVEVGHNREVLERKYPRVPFTWLQTSGGDGFVFLLTAHELGAPSLTNAS